MSRREFEEFAFAHVPAGTKALLSGLAKSHGITISDTVRDALGRYLQQHGLEVPSLLEERRPRLLEVKQEEAVHA